ncbi:acyltransferase [Enterobacter hormaechei subsp. xiangfangensis]|nr:acyltransferase [Enterobacter hormaechei subsp. xiangfangensis]MCU2753045.1 acyltransferase [Enterobacter hormaechei subsp. xiangfangensis]MCU2997264.1 acyltransferase [Enterobacter hormaechei subsp. xiangfangensis]
MNATGLNIIKTLGCMTAVTFFTIYNTWDRYDYDYHWILGFLTFISTIATPLFFVVAGYLDGQSRHGTRWQLDKIKRLVIVFLFWVTIYYLWEPYQRGYLIQPWFVFAFIVIYTFHPVVERLSQRRMLFCGVIAALLLFSYGYDLLSALYPDAHVLSLSPQYRLWTWLLFYLTGQLFCDPQIAAWIGCKNVVGAAVIAIPFIYLFTWFYERHFFFALFKADRNAFILTGSQIYILIIALVIAANGVRFRRNAEFKESVLAAISKTMTGVYIMHYSVFHLLTALIPVTSLSTKLVLIVLTFVTSVLFSLLILSNAVAKKVITL